MSNAFQTDASISKITKASSLKDSPLERPPGDNSLKSHVAYEETPSLKKKTKKRNKLKRKHDALSLGPEDENCLQKDLETPQNNPALGRKQKRKNQKEKLNASENCNIHNDHEVGSVLVENPPLKSDVDVNSVQNNTILGAKKKKKRKKKKKHNALEDSDIHNKLEDGSSLVENPPLLERNSSLQPPFNCLKMDTEMVDYSLKSDVGAVLVDHEVGSVLVENPPLKSDVDVESVQNNTILRAKKKKKHNALEDSNIRNELDNGSSLVENPLLEINSSLQPPLNCLKMDTEMVDNSLKSDVEYEAKSSLKKEKNKIKKEKKKRNKLKRKHDASILEAQVDNCLPKDLETAKQRKKRKNEKEKPNASENCNIDNDHEEDSVLTENPSLKSDVNVESVQNNATLGVKKKKKRKKKNKKHNALEDGSARNDLEEGSLLVENLATLKRDVDMKNAQNNEALVCKKKEKRNKEEKGLKASEDNFFNDPSGFDPSCKLLEQKNVLMELQIEEKKPSFSKQVPIEDGTDLLVNSKANPPQVLISSPLTALSGHSRKKLLILDVNGLLADIVPYASNGYKPDITISGKKVFKRPFCEDFLQFCLERFDVGVWSSRTKKNVAGVINFLMGNSIDRLLFCWDQSHCTYTGFKTLENKDKPLVLKELRKLWEKRERNLPWEKGEYNESNTLLLDDSPYKALRNPAHTAIFPHSYHYDDTKDCSLGPGGDLRVYLEGLATSENVQDYVKQNPFGQIPITESNLSWWFYRKIISIDS